MSTLLKQESKYSEFTEYPLPSGVSECLVQNQSSPQMGVFVYVGTSQPSADEEGMLVRDWMTFPVAGGEKLFHRAQYEVHPVVNSAYIRVTVA